MRRRQFTATMAAAGFQLSTQGQASDTSSFPTPEVIQLSRNGWMPNNDRLPVLLYRKAIRLESDDPGSLFEALFERNGWPAQWRNGVYDYHHYHSTAHEVLGFAGGQAKLMLGGENGHILDVYAGDVAVLPTGTGHCKLAANSDFLVIGAYPRGQHWDICRKAPEQEAIDRMRHLPFPKTDPVGGSAGALVRVWQATS